MSQGEDRSAHKVLSTRAIVISMFGLAVIGVGVAVALVLVYGGGTDSDRIRLDAIRTAGTIVVGTGGAAALWLAARRQQTTEIALRQKEIDQVHQERVASHNEAVAAAAQSHQDRVAIQSEHDAAERRVTELYTKAVEQLGSDKAPVRLGGMYALERLAQNVPDQRQTIVNVLCAYLRMPYIPPIPRSSTSTEGTHTDAARPSNEDADVPMAAEVTTPRGQDENERRHQERQVRLTAERILAGHLRPGDNPEHPADTFWNDIDLDLTGASLFDLDLSRCQIRIAQFSGATFSGDVWFDGVTFSGDARFDGVTFSGDARFDGVTFSGDARFDRTTFSGDARFDRTTFSGKVWFDRTIFSGKVWFDRTTFNRDTRFIGTTFSKDAGFHKADFGRIAAFPEATFSGGARFSEAKFRLRPCYFNGARVRLDDARGWPDMILRVERIWPEGVIVVEPGTEDEAPPPDQEGKWGYLTVVNGENPPPVEP